MKHFISSAPPKGREREKEERRKKNVGERQNNERKERLATCTDKEYFNVCERAHFFA